MPTPNPTSPVARPVFGLPSSHQRLEVLFLMAEPAFETCEASPCTAVCCLLLLCSVIAWPVHLATGRCKPMLRNRNDTKRYHSTRARTKVSCGCVAYLSPHVFKWGYQVVGPTSENHAGAAIYQKCGVFRKILSTIALSENPPCFWVSLAISRSLLPCFQDHSPMLDEN